MPHIAIVGLGPWGLCALERIVTLTRKGEAVTRDLDVHVVESGTPGSGVYDVTQPDYLLLNNPCGQISLYPFASEADQPPYGVGLHEWSVRQGYRWVGDVCSVDASGRPIDPHDFVPRRLMGEYLQWFYQALVAAAPPTVRIFHHPTTAIDLVATADGREEVHLADGRTVVVDHVIVTSGHTDNEDDPSEHSNLRRLSAYPVTRYADGLPSGATVAVAGMGLVALDVVAALTVGRGGRFVDEGQGLRYLRGGRETSLRLFSRSGLPYTAKSVTGVDRSDVYRPIIATPEAFNRLTGAAGSPRRQVDVRTELLPLLFAEMYARYYAQVAFQRGTAADAADVRAGLGAAWKEDRFRDELDILAARFGGFDAEALFFGHQPRYESSGDYAGAVYRALAEDLREAEVSDGASPVKSAAEVFRIFRDPMRRVVEHGGLSLQSYLDFNADIRSRINRLVAGPPALRSRQLLALMDAGVLDAPYGPAPALGPTGDRDSSGQPRTRIGSTAFAKSYIENVDVVIRGHLEDPRIEGSTSLLLSRLYGRGRLRQFRYGTVNVGSVDLTTDGHPIDLDGCAAERLWMFGVLTEGVRHFTHYIPSPKSRIRAFDDLGACVSAILG